MSDSRILQLLVLTAHEALDEGVIMGDGTRVLHVNDAACRHYGRTRDELLEAASLFGFLTQTEQRRVQAVVDDALTCAEPVPQRFETVIARPDGSELPAEMSTTALVEGTETRTLTLIRDISERRLHQAELERLALHDPLTGLPNRRLLMERLGHIAARGRREPVAGALFFLDVDSLKPINDALGHDAGDRVLMGVADALRDGLRSCDSVARLGGDEFVVICESIDDDDAAERLRTRLLALVAAPITMPDARQVTVSVSIGVQRFGGEAIDPDAVLSGADAAMYRAKAARPRPL